MKLDECTGDSLYICDRKFTCDAFQYIGSEGCYELISACANESLPMLPLDGNSRDKSPQLL